MYYNTYKCFLKQHIQMKKSKKDLILGAAFAAIVLSACDNQKAGSWDGNDYYTGRDTTINNRTYRHSNLGYWYWFNNGNVTRYYPNTGFTETLPAETHRSGTFLNSGVHTSNGGYHASPTTFSSSRGGVFGGTSRGGSFHAIS